MTIGFRLGRIWAARWLCAAALLQLPGGTALAREAATQAASPPPAAALPTVRPRETSTLTVQSRAGLQYRIEISVPEGPPPPTGFPVLYILDANAWFGVAAEITRLYELEGGPAIVVGVGYPVDSLYAPQRRGHDFTLGPPVTSSLAVYEGTDFGGANAFLDFLSTDLRDEIGSRHPIDRARQSLFGHSLGGYFVLHVLLTRPDAFAAYVAASPAIWWDQQRLIEAADRVASRPHVTDPPGVLVAAGSAEQELGAADINLFRRLHAANPAQFGHRPIDEVIAQTRAQMAKSKMVDNAHDFAARLTGLGIPADFVAFAGENHRSVVPVSLQRGMPILFQVDR